MKYLLIMTTSDNVVNFRMTLINRIIELGHKVAVIANDNHRKEEILQTGSSFFEVKNKNRSLNPISSIVYKRNLSHLIEQLKPDVVFTFQSKPNIFGSFATRKKKGIDLFCMVEGAGAPFTYNTLKWRTIKRVECYLYRKAFKNAKRVFFLNEDDADDFVKMKIVNESQKYVINGIGVDLQKFSFSPINSNKISFLMVARMLEAKGVIHYCKCAEIVKKRFPFVEFKYLGSEADIRVSDIQYYIRNHIVEYCGNVNDVVPYLRESTVLILPSSYREGKPMSIMEAQSVGRPVITTINTGCKDTVIDGVNGFLVEKHNVNQMAERCIFAIENPGIMVEMGINARRFAEENFDSNKINEEILKVIDKCVVKK